MFFLYPKISFFLFKPNAQLRGERSEAIPYELLITVMNDVGEELRSWVFAFILTGYHRAGIVCQRR